MRDNEERFLDKESSEFINNNLSFISPEELVELPSGGKLYPLDHILYRKRIYFDKISYG